MRIACLSDDRYPSSNANTQQIVKSAAALARRPGLEVDLVVPRLWQTIGMASDYRRRRIEEYYSVSDSRFGLREVVTWMPTPLRFHKLSHGLVAPLATALSSYDVVYTRNFLPLLLGLATGQKMVFETYRLLGRQYPVLQEPIRKVAAHPCFLGVVVHSNLARDVMLETGVPEDKIEVLHNGYDPSDLEPRLGRREARAELARKLGWRLDPDAHVVTYAGRIDPDKGMDVVLDMAASTPDVTYIFVGNTNRRDPGWLERAAAARGLHNVLRAGRVDPASLAPFLYSADVLLIPPTRGPLEKRGNTVLPIKTFSYLAAGRPILAPDLPDTAELLEEGRNALLVEPDDPKAAANALRGLFADPARWMKLAETARKDGAALTWDARAERFEAFLRRRMEAARKAGCEKNR